MSRPIQIDAKGNVTFQLNIWRTLNVIVILILAIGSQHLPIPGLEENVAAQISMMIFIGAAGLWVTEAVPSFCDGHHGHCSPYLPV